MKETLPTGCFFSLADTRPCSSKPCPVIPRSRRNGRQWLWPLWVCLQPWICYEASPQSGKIQNSGAHTAYFKCKAGNCFLHSDYTVQNRNISCQFVEKRVLKGSKSKCSKFPWQEVNKKDGLCTSTSWILLSVCLSSSFKIYPVALCVVSFTQKKLSSRKVESKWGQNDCVTWVIVCRILNDLIFRITLLGGMRLAFRKKRVNQVNVRFMKQLTSDAKRF